MPARDARTGPARDATSRRRRARTASSSPREPNGNIRSTGVFVYEVKGGKLNSLGTTEELSR